MAEDIQLLSRPGTPIARFLTPSADTQLQGNPFSGDAKYTKYTGWDKFAIFNGNRRLSRKRYEIGPWLLWNMNRKSQVVDQYVSVPMTLKGGTQ